MKLKSTVDWMEEINKAQPVWEHGFNNYTLIDTNKFRVLAFSENMYSFPNGSGTSRLEDYDWISVTVYENRRSKFGKHEMFYQALYLCNSEEVMFQKYYWAKFWPKHSPIGQVIPKVLCDILKDVNQLNELAAFL